jgi:hypothetical protein
LSQVLQTRRNHETFRIHRIAVENRPDLHQRFGVVELPTIAVVVDNRLATRSRPMSVDDIGFLLAPWLDGGYRQRASLPLATENSHLVEQALGEGEAPARPSKQGGDPTRRQHALTAKSTQAQVADPMIVHARNGHTARSR